MSSLHPFYVATTVLLLKNKIYCFGDVSLIACGGRGRGEVDFGQKPLDGEENFEINGGTRGDFNLYIFAMSWKPEW